MGKMRKLGAAQAVFFESAAWTRVKVDLVSPQSLGGKDGVDCDVGNLCLRYADGNVEMQLKTRATGGKDIIGSVEESVEHCLQKKFVFYLGEYLGESARCPRDQKLAAYRRLNKYKDRKWTRIRKPWHN